MSSMIQIRHPAIYHLLTMIFKASKIGLPLFISAFMIYRLSNFGQSQKDLTQNTRIITDTDTQNLATLGGKKEYQVSEDIKRWFGDTFQYPQNIEYTDVVKYPPADFCPTNYWLDYLIVVKSDPESYIRREMIRTTFGQKNIFGHLTQRVVFVLGLPDGENKDNISKLISTESDNLKDLLQVPYIEAYNNLTLKGIAAIQWIALKCPKPKVIMFIDDYVFVNIFGVIKHWLPDFTKNSHHVGCHYFRKGKKPIERKRTKWAVMESEFRNEKTFPVDHCQGYFVMMTADMIGPMLGAIKVNPFFFIDDIYLYGLLFHTVGDVTLTSFGELKTFTLLEHKTCLETRGVDCEYLFYGDFYENNIFIPNKKQLWTSLVSNLTDTQRKFYHLK